VALRPLPVHPDLSLELPYWLLWPLVLLLLEGSLDELEL